MNIEEGMTCLPEYIFYNCGLESVELPDSMKWIDRYAFESCKKLKSVVMPDMVQYVGQGAFSYCESLESVELSENIEYLGGHLSGHNSDYTYNWYYSKSEGSVFAYCTSLKSVTLPESLKYLGESTFAGCSSLENLVFEGEMSALESGMFSGCIGLKYITLPQGLVTLSSSMFSSCIAIESIVFPDSITTIENGCFRSCISLKSVELSGAIKTIGDSSFQGCTALETFKITSDGAVVIGKYCFQDCELLETVELNGTVTSLGTSCFQNCDSLESIVIPSSVTSIGDYCFYDCDELEDVTIGLGLTNIPQYSFSHCDSLEDIVIPNNITSINTFAFANCTKLKTAYIPASVTSIGEQAFSYIDTMTVYGQKGSYAETWAEYNFFNFVELVRHAESVSLNRSEMSLNKGEKGILLVTVEPEGYTDDVIWKSSASDIVSVDGMGYLTAKSVGTATISVLAGDKSATCEVTVTQPVTGISLNRSSISMETLQTVTLTATVSPANAVNKNVTWSSSDDTVATVDEDGVVEALTKGTAVIYATAQDGSGVYATCSVTVVNSGKVVESVEELESAHNYACNANEVWLYTIEGAKELYVTFANQTSLEEKYDYLYIYGETLVGQYTGAQLAGKTVRVSGDTLKLQLLRLNIIRAKPSTLTPIQHFMQYGKQVFIKSVSTEMVETRCLKPYPKLMEIQYIFLRIFRFMKNTLSWDGVTIRKLKPFSINREQGSPIMRILFFMRYGRMSK